MQRDRDCLLARDWWMQKTCFFVVQQTSCNRLYATVLTIVIKAVGATVFLRCCYGGLFNRVLPLLFLHVPLYSIVEVPSSSYRYRPCCRFCLSTNGTIAKPCKHGCSFRAKGGHGGWYFFRSFPSHLWKA